MVMGLKCAKDVSEMGANLVPDIFPTLGKILDNQQMDPAVNNAKGKKNTQDMRTV
jgi:hypothetical protein